MAADNVNQVGKYIQKTQKDTKKALDRYHSTIPRIERVRDVFDSQNSFAMEFETAEDDQQVVIDLIFNEPPPFLECNSDCATAACQSFTIDGGNKYITTDVPYNANSISAYINGGILDPSQVDQVNPAAGAVFIQTGVIPEVGVTHTMTVCYTYGECPPPEIFNCVGVHSRMFTAITPIFSDRFDRIAYAETLHPGFNPTWTSATAGGCGVWTGLGASAINLIGDGSATVLSSATPASASAASFEIIVAAKITSNANNFRVFRLLSRSNEFGSVDYGVEVEYSIELGQPKLALRVPYTVDIPGFPNEHTGFLKTIDYPDLYNAVAALGSVDVFIRLVQIPSNGWYLNIWKQNQIEPIGWTLTVNEGELVYYPQSQLSPSLPDYGAIYDLECTFTTGSRMQAVTIWGVSGPGRYSARSSSVVGTLGNYFLNMARTHDPYPPPFPIFGYSSEYIISVTPYSSPLGLEDRGPFVQLGVTFPVFGTPGAHEGDVVGAEQDIASFDVTGHIASVQIEGEIILGASEGKYLYAARGVSLMAFSHGVDPPTRAGEKLLGTSTLFSQPIDGLNWVPFNITIPALNGKVQWGVGFTEDYDQIAQSLDGPDGFPIISIYVSFRNLRATAHTILLCSSHPFCPDTVANAEIRGIVL